VNSQTFTSLDADISINVCESYSIHGAINIAHRNAPELMHNGEMRPDFVD